MYILVFSSETNIGCACNRPAQDGEFEITTEDWKIGEPFLTRCNTFKYIDGVVVEIEDLVKSRELKIAKDAKLYQLLELRKSINNEYPFIFNGNTYVNDEANIQGVKVQILDKPTTNPLPTFKGTPMVGCWKTYNDDFVPMTNGEFIDGLCETYFDMRSHNYTNYGILYSTINNLDNVEDVENFDISIGWSNASVI